MRVLDSHLHLWDPEVLTYDWLEGALDYRFAEIELFEEQIDGVDEEVSIFVEADAVEGQQVDEVRWADSIALAAGAVAIVAGARLDRGAETEAHLATLAEHERVVGVRHRCRARPTASRARPPFSTGRGPWPRAAGRSTRWCGLPSCPMWLPSPPPCPSCRSCSIISVSRRSAQPAFL